MVLIDPGSYERLGRQWQQGRPLLLEQFGFGYGLAPQPAAEVVATAAFQVDQLSDSSPSWTAGTGTRKLRRA